MSSIVTAKSSYIILGQKRSLSMSIYDRIFDSLVNGDSYTNLNY